MESLLLNAAVGVGGVRGWICSASERVSIEKTGRLAPNTAKVSSQNIKAAVEFLQTPECRDDHVGDDLGAAAVARTFCETEQS